MSITARRLVSNTPASASTSPRGPKIADRPTHSFRGACSSKKLVSMPVLTELFTSVVNTSL